MTPQEHLDAAEAELRDVRTAIGDIPDGTAVASVLLALAHAVTALAIELGVPHSTPPAGGDQGG